MAGQGWAGLSWLEEPSCQGANPGSVHFMLSLAIGGCPNITLFKIGSLGQ